MEIEQTQPIAMLLIHIFFWVSILLISMAAYYWVRLIGGNPKLDPKGKALSWWVWASFVVVGVLGITASAPGLFFDKPHWFTDKLYWVVEKLIA